MASEYKSCHASAISSAGSPTMITGFMWSAVTNLTARPTSFRRTKAANQLGACGVLAPVPSAGGGNSIVSWPMTSMSKMRTWRRCLSCNGSSSSS